MVFKDMIYSFLLLLTFSCSDNNTTNELKELNEGDILWQSESIGENLESAPAIDDSSNIYVIGGGAVHSYQLDGTKRWAVEVHAVDFNTPSVSPNNQTVYCGGSDGLFALAASSGKIKWHTSGFPTGFHSVPAVSQDNSRIYIGIGAERDEGDIFYCFNADNGIVMWEYDMPYEAYGFHGYLGGAIIAHDGTIFLTSQHGWLIALTDDGNSFTENWACKIGAEMRMPPAMDTNGFLYVGDSEKGQIHKVDSRTGIEVGGNWPVSVNTDSNERGEVFANIAIGADGTIYANSEDERIWAINKDGTIKWNNIQFEVWGSDPLIRNDGKIIVVSQIKDAARVACIRDDGLTGVIEWTSDPVSKTLLLNETNVNIAPDGTILVHSGEHQPQALFALMGNGMGLSTTSPWPKYMGNIKNNGLRN